MISVEYIDEHEYPREDSVIWEREINAEVFSSFSFPEIADISLQPDPPERFHAFIDALRWTGQGSYCYNGDNVEYLPSDLLSPSFSAVQVEDYQLYPVLKALAMPRTNLLLADDVGLGKTIEAGLIAQELIRQKRIRRMIIICPSSLQIQWQDEMKEKFNIDFTILDSAQVFRMQREVGVDANPWKMYPRIIVSMDYLKQPDILNQFIATSQQLGSRDSAMLPWDLLIVDEAHNFSPSRFADDSQRCSMLREVAMYCDHHLFLSATPHNGYTVSFTGLLEMLDPIRFQQKSVLEEEDMSNIGEIMVRRMKEDLNTDQDNPRFPRRNIKGIALEFPEEETRIYDALRAYRNGVSRQMARYGKGERVVAEFIFSVLTKRLLSSSYAFAKTWWDHVEGTGLEGFGFEEADASMKRALTPVEDDMEKDQRDLDAVRHGGGWLSKYRDIVAPYQAEITRQLERMGWGRRAILQNIDEQPSFPSDIKFESLLTWIRDNLMEGSLFRSDERVIIFTEYKNTLDYLVARFRAAGIDEPYLQTLYGGASTEHRRGIKNAFNDPASQLRILLATEVASEGLNLQQSCRYVIHQEIPWNPMRLEQRNGRVDRHGQSRDVTIFHFVSDQVEELKFLDFIVKKVDTVREDLGSVGKVLDDAVLEYFSKGSVTQTDVDTRIELTHQYTDESNDTSHAKRGSETEYESAVGTYDQTMGALGITETSLARLLDQAMHLENGDLEFQGEGIWRIRKMPPHWKNLIENTILISGNGAQGAQPKIVFSPERVQEKVNGRMIFHPGSDSRLLMLGHPMMQRALSTFRRRVWLSPNESGLRRWTVERGVLPDSTQAVFYLSYDIALRNQLGERFHTGILEVPVGFGTEMWILGEDDSEKIRMSVSSDMEDADVARARASIASHWFGVQRYADELKSGIISSLNDTVGDELQKHYHLEEKEQLRLFAERRRSLELRKDDRSIAKLKKELLRAKEKATQLTFDPEENLLRKQELELLKERVSEKEWERQHDHLERLKERLAREEDRIINRVLPGRYSLDKDGIEFHPVAVHVIVNRSDA
ncbi:hypothetical protein AZH53_03110 [Methanomicrobiaceae archaeon CYW5]|nr:hypothetical protein [Methanovulcanius yangii]